MKIKSMIVVAGLVAVPVLGGAAAYASTTPAVGTTATVVSATTEAASPNSVIETDTGGANIQQGPNVNVQSGSTSGVDAQGVDTPGAGA